MIKFVTGLLVGMVLMLIISFFLRSYTLNNKLLKTPRSTLYSKFVVNSDYIFVLSDQLDDKAIAQSSLLQAVDKKSFEELWRYPTNGVKKDVQIIDGKIYLLGNFIHVLDATNGTEIFKYQIKDGYAQSILAENERIYCQTDRSVFALNTKSGLMLWEIPTNNYITSPNLQLTETDVIFIAADGTINAVDKISGKERFKASFPKL